MIERENFTGSGPLLLLKNNRRRRFETEVLNLEPKFVFRISDLPPDAR
jgi:hypothetical protein